MPGRLDGERRFPGVSRTLESVRSRIIDGGRWIDRRLTFLRGKLAADPSDAERKAIEAEIEKLSKERAMNCTGVAHSRLPRRRRRTT